MTNTLDRLRKNQSIMLPGVPVLFDDVGGDEDDVQMLYSSISMWKSVLQIKDATQNRARNGDLMWAARQPKVLTTNCNNLDIWIRTMFPKATDPGEPQRSDYASYRGSGEYPGTAVLECICASINQLATVY